MNKEVGNMYEEVGAAYFKAIYWNLPAGTKGNNEISP